MSDFILLTFNAWCFYSWLFRKDTNKKTEKNIGKDFHIFVEFSVVYIYSTCMGVCETGWYIANRWIKKGFHNDLEYNSSFFKIQTVFIWHLLQNLNYKAHIHTKNNYLGLLGNIFIKIEKQHINPAHFCFVTLLSKEVLVLFKRTALSILWN